MPAELGRVTTYISRLGLCAAILLLAAPALPQSVDFNTPAVLPDVAVLALADFNGTESRIWPWRVAHLSTCPGRYVGQWRWAFQTGPSLYCRRYQRGRGRLQRRREAGLGAAITYAGIIAVLLGNGDGTFQAPLEYPVAMPDVLL